MVPVQLRWAILAPGGRDAPNELHVSLTDVAERHEQTSRSSKYRAVLAQKTT
jgi:hypothetical protein